MVTNADEIRAYVVEKYIQPARRDGREVVNVLVKDVRNRMGQELGEYPDPTSISQALGVRKFLNDQNLQVLKQHGWAGYDYKIVGSNPFDQLPESIKLEQEVGTLAESELEEDAIAKLHKHIADLTQDEFENLVRAYAQSKGFSSVEVTVTLKMEI